MTHGNHILLPPNHPLIPRVLESLHRAGQGALVEDILVAGTTLTQITVVGKRVGEGQIAQHMKGRKP